MNISPLNAEKKGGGTKIKLPQKMQDNPLNNQLNRTSLMQCDCFKSAKCGQIISCRGKNLFCWKFW